MKASELRALSDDDLVRKLGESRRDLLNLRFQSVTGSLDSSAKLRRAKHEIARILTIQHERARLGKA